MADTSHVHHHSLPPPLPFYTKISQSFVIHSDYLTEATQNTLQNSVPTDSDILCFSRDCSRQGQHLYAAAVVQSFFILGGLFEHGGTQEFCTSFHLLNGQVADDEVWYFINASAIRTWNMHYFTVISLLCSNTKFHYYMACVTVVCYMHPRVILVIMILKPQNQTAHTCQI